MDAVFGKLLLTFGTAMVPVLELRGAIPVGVAALLDIRLRSAIPAIFAGLVIAGAITTAVTMGVVSLF